MTAQLISTPAERELHFAILFLVEAYEDLTTQIARVKREGTSAALAAAFHQDLVKVSQTTDDAVAALAQIVTESQMEKLPHE